jgi:C1A family cysteine protease
MPQRGEAHHGGHAVLAVGYDDLAHPHLSEDFWTLRAVAG